MIMASINLIKASDGTGNASTPEVQTVRLAGSPTIIVDTVNNLPATFKASMGTPHTFIDPVTNEEIKVISEATEVSFTGHVSGSNLEIDSIDPGYTDNGSAVGDIIVIRPTTEWANNIAEVLLTAHDQTGAITTDTIAEKTAASGVTIDGMTIKDSIPYCNTIAEKTAASGVTIDGLNIKDGKLNTANSVVTTNITDASVTSGKLAEAFFKGRRQANTTNSDISGYKVQHGWGFMLGSGTNSSSKTVTLPTAFSTSAYIVVVTCLGYKTGSDPSGETDSTLAPTIIPTAKITNSSTFSVNLYDVSASMGATTRFLYTWVAIGAA